VALNDKIIFPHGPSAYLLLDCWPSKVDLTSFLVVVTKAEDD